MPAGGPPKTPVGAITLDERRSPDPDPALQAPPRPLGLRAQLRFTRDAGFRLAHAHIDLARAEASAIMGEVGRAAALVGVAVAVVLLAVVLLFVGTSLFLGEWLLGSLGWGVLHGVLLLTAIALACGLAVLGGEGSAGRIGRALVVALLVLIGVGVLLVPALPNQLYTRIGESALPGVEPGIRPLVVAAAIWGVIGLVGGLIAAFRMQGGGSRLGALLAGALLGALIGALTAVNAGPQVAIGIAIAAGYLTWIGLLVADVARARLDTEALKARFYPTQTIETSKETLEWLKRRLPGGGS